MKVDIKDKAALQEIPPERVEEYLQAHDWTKIREIVGTRPDIKGALYRKGEDVHETQVNLSEEPLFLECVFPLTTSVRDYAARIADVLNNLEKDENRSQLNIYADLTGKSIVIHPGEK